MQTLGIIANPTKKGFDLVLSQIATWSQESKMRIIFCDQLTPFITRPVAFLPIRKLIEQVDGILVLGGDGTILSVINEIGTLQKPVLAINLGHLGFLAETPVDQVTQALERLQADDFKLEYRMMIQAEIQRMGRAIKQVYALNEIVVAKGDFARIIELETFVGNEFVSTYSADGLIVATPTGSTGYSLSAGGPIVAPHMEALITTPICAHTLAVRPLIISANEVFRVKIKSNMLNILMTADGRGEYTLAYQDEVVISRAHYDANLIRTDHSTFYSILREKFKWGARETSKDR